MLTESEIVANLNDVQARVSRACERVSRSPESVSLLVATKSIPLEMVRAVARAGVVHLGENKVQELVWKQSQTQDLLVHWHLIGHLQRNKVRQVTGIATCIQSVDSLALVQAIDTVATARGLVQPVLVQINASGESSKQGLPPNEALSFVRRAASYEAIRVAGLMTIGPTAAPTEEVRRCFQTLSKLAEVIVMEEIPKVDMSTISMGMSADFEIAIEEGATMIRLGAAIFGSRVAPQ